MRAFLVAACLALATTAIPCHALAGTNAGPAVLSPDARDAAQVVDAFMESLVDGDLEGARAQMSADAVVIANGHAIGLRDDYIGGPAKDDAAALRTVRRELLRRDVRTGTDVAWVVSEKRVRPATALEGTGPSEVVIETMLLARTAAGWKITHVHWSGRHG